MIEVRTLSRGQVGTTSVDDAAFRGRPNPVVLREAVLMYEANRRVGTASTKTRSEVRGTTRKAYRQKGTGRARHGDRKAPLFRGGGVAHGPKPRDYSYGIPRKALRRALRLALGGKLADGEILRWEGPVLPEGSPPSTKAVRGSLALLGAEESALLVAADVVAPPVLLSIRNLPRVRALPAREVTAYDVVRHRWLVLLDGAWEALLARVGGGGTTAARSAGEEGAS